MKSKKPLLAKKKTKSESVYPFNPEFERNMPVLLKKFKRTLTGSERVLEIGSGSGEHAVYFAKAMPELSWQPTDLPDYLPTINELIESSKLKNIKIAEVLDISKKNQLNFVADVVYTSKTMHVLPWGATKNMIIQSAKVLPFKGLFMIYGPFKYKGEHTSQSNQYLDVRITKMNRHHGIRDFEEVKKVANQHSLIFKYDFKLPIDNHLLVFSKA